MRNAMQPDDAWRERLRERHVPTIARSLTAIERSPEFARAIAGELFAARSGLCIGVTGAPGAGKSSLVNRLIERYRAREQTVAVLAVDPSSAATGGAVLGDRIRMEEHVLDRGVYVRSLSTRGQLGGLSRSALLMSQLLKYAGFDRVIIETVGIGQSELDIVGVADLTALVFVPGMGDHVQAIKSGVMEIGDVFVLNKSDHPGIQALKRIATEEALDRARTRGAATPICITNALTGEGVEALVEAVDELVRARAQDDVDGAGTRRLLRFADQLLADYLNGEFKRRFLASDGFAQFRSELCAGRQSPVDVLSCFEGYLDDYGARRHSSAH